MADVFISYKTERRNAAQHLSRILELNGYSVWFDYGLLSGTDFGPQIEREIRAAKAVVVLWCSLSRESRWVLEEADLALRLGSLTPAWLERVEPPLGFARADTIDLASWDGAPRSHALDRLLSEIARRVGRDPTPSFRGLQEYEATWRSFGAPPLSDFALSVPAPGRKEGLARRQASVSDPSHTDLSDVRKQLLLAKTTDDLRRLRHRVEIILEDDRRNVDARQLRDKIDEALRYEGLRHATPASPSPLVLASRRRTLGFGMAAALALLVAVPAVYLQFRSREEPISKLEPVRSFAGHTAPVDSTAFSPDGRLLASGSNDRTIKLWNFADGTPLLTITGHSGQSVSFSPDGRWIASGSDDKTVAIWDVASGRLARTFSEHTDKVIAVAFAPDGRTIVSGGLDKTIWNWSVDTGRAIWKTAAHTGAVWSIAISPDSSQIVSAGQYQSVSILDLRTGKVLTTVLGQTKFTAATFSPDGAQIVAGGEDGAVQIWGARDGRAIATLTGHSAVVTGVKYSRDGKSIASSSYDGTIKIWSSETRQIRQTLKANGGQLESVALSPDGRWIVAGSRDKTVKVWQMP